MLSQRRLVHCQAWFCLLIISLIMASPQSRMTAAPLTDQIATIGQLGGLTSTIYVNGDYAYIGVGPRLVTLDISQPATPVAVNFSDILSGTVTDIASNGLFVYVMVSPANLYVFRLSNPASPVQSGSIAIPNNSDLKHYLNINGSNLYSVIDDNLYIYDISNPYDPKQVGNYPLGVIEVSDLVIEPRQGMTLAYFSGLGGGLKILDVTHPLQPALLKVDNRWGSLAGLEIVSGNLYALSSWGLHILDASDWDQLTEVGFASLPDLDGDDILVDNDIAYVSSWGDGLRVIDCSDRSYPHIVSTIYPPRYTYAMYFYGYHLYLAGDDKNLRLMDVSRPGLPVLEGQYRTLGQVQNFQIVGDRVYLAAGVGGLAIARLVEGSNPVLLSTLDIPGTVKDVAANEHNVYLASDDGGLQIVDASDLDHPRLVGANYLARRAARVVIDNAYLYAIVGNSLHIFDLADSLNPVEISEYIPTIDCLDLVVQGQTAYLATRSGLEIVDLKDAYRPSLVGVWDTTFKGFAPRIKVEGNKVYLSDSWGDLWIVDVSEPRRPSWLGAFHAGNGIEDIVVRDAFVYMVNLDRIQVVDFTQVQNPSPVAQHDLPGDAARLMVDRENIYVSSPGLGLMDLWWTAPFFHLYGPMVLYDPVPSR